MTTDPLTMDSIMQLLLEKGSTMAISLAIIWILIKKILEQYEKRIERCEGENTECREDRAALHNKVEAIQQERILELVKRVGETE